jgi:hypothetical protein
MPQRGAAAHNQRKSRLWHQQPGFNYFVDAYDLCNNVVLSFLLIIRPLFFSAISEPYQRSLILFFSRCHSLEFLRASLLNTIGKYLRYLHYLHSC